MYLSLVWELTHQDTYKSMCPKMSLQKESIKPVTATALNYAPQPFYIGVGKQRIKDRIRMLVFFVNIGI